MTVSLHRMPRPLATVAALGALAGGLAHATEPTLPQVVIEGGSLRELADGPVQGYRATRSATFTKTDTPLKEVPASVSVVPAQLMQDQAMHSLADALRYVPGATAHQGEGNRDQFILRGISTSADFYVDGIRDDAQVFRDLYNLERVEVLKGTGGMIFGRGGAGGVINRVTRRPVFAHVGDASLAIGNDRQWRGTLDVGNRLGDAAAWRLNAAAETGDSFRNGFDLKRLAIHPTVTLLTGPQTSLTFGFEHLEDQRTADRGIPAQFGRPYATDPSTFFGNAGQSEARATFDSFAATLDHDLGGGLQIRNSFRATHYDKYYQNVYADNANASSVSAAGTMRLAAYNNANRRTNVFNQTDLTAKLEAGGFQHTLLAGIELGHQNSTSRRNTGFFGAATLATVTASNPFAIATSFRANGSDADNQVRADAAAVYVQDQIALNRDWQLLAGLRYDRFRAIFDDRRTTTPAVDLARTDSSFSPRLGLIWSPTVAATYYASYSYSFLPSAETLGLAANTVDLAPETAKNYEVGARWDLSPTLALSAAVFRLDRDDVRSPDPLNPGLFVKTGQQRTEGLELGLQGEMTKNWQVYGGLAKLDGRITRTTSAATAGARLQLVPERMLALWNRVELGGGLAAGLGIVHQSSSFTTVDNAVTLPGFWRADGALYYAFADGRTKLALNVENLFDKVYFPTADGNNNISPGAPRNARLTISTRF